MIHRPFLCLVGALLLAAPRVSVACTTAVLSGRATADGRPMLWKQRDTGTAWNHIVHLQGERFDFTGLVNSADTLQRDIWTGVNTAGFAIMNNASYNLKPDSLRNLPEREGRVMKQALRECRTVADFVQMIEQMPQPRCLEANFGVIDAEGGAAYVEVWDYGYTLFDANDPALAPNGYLLRTNFSFSGGQDEGMGYVRYQNAEYLFHRAYVCGVLDGAWMLDGAARSFYNALLGVDLCAPGDKPRTGWAVDQDFIARRLTSASIVVEGVRAGEDPAAATMWCTLGYPPCSYALAVWAAAGDALPAPLAASCGEHAPLNRMAVALKGKAFPVHRGNGSHYLHIGWLAERVMPIMRYAEAEERAAGSALRKRFLEEGFDAKAVAAYNREAALRFDRIREQSAAL